MYFIWDLGSPEANLAAFNQFNNAYHIIMEQGSNDLKAIFEALDMQYPNAAGTERYADPISHPVSGKVAMPAPGAILGNLSETLRLELWTLITEPSEIVAGLSVDWLPESTVE